MKKSAYAIALTALAATVAYAAVPAVSPERIDVAIEAINQQNQAQGGQTIPADKLANAKKDIAVEIQKSDLLKNEALKLGLDKDAKVQAQLQNVESQFYAQQFIEHLKKSITISDADLLAVYNSMAMEHKLQIAVFHSAEEANAAKEKLLKGMSFEDLVKTLPDQAPGNNQYVNLAQLPPPIKNALSRLTRGQITPEPVNFNGAYMLLKLADSRKNPNVPGFDQVKNQLADQAKIQKIQAQIEQLFKDNGLPVTPPQAQPPQPQ